MELALAVLAAYLLGSVNFSLLVGRMTAGVDLRRVGSGNPGMSNAWRTLGWRPAVTILVLDVGRGVALTLAAERLLPECRQLLPVVMALVVGNLFPVFHRFRGGKGFATSLGIYLALQPELALVCGLAWMAISYPTKLASLGTLLSAGLFPLLVLLTQGTVCSLWVGLAGLCVILFSHRGNLARLLRGREHRLGG